ncbi:hypothetical protein ACIQY8_30350 [Streptomyces albidoflavus]
MSDASAARTVQREAADQGNAQLAAHLGTVVDAHLDDALDHQRFVA